MIVDAHVHLGDVAQFRIADPSAEAMLVLMDCLGIDVSISAHFAGLVGCFEDAYQASEAAHERSGGRLPYWLVYHPLCPKDSLAWIERAWGRPGLVGVKIHPAQHQVFPEDVRYEPVWRMAAERGLPILTHSWALSDYNPTQRYATPEHFESRVARFPEVTIILGHAGGRYEGHLAAARLAQRYANVYLDLSGDVYSFGLVEWLVGQVGADRILFGSDAVWIDPRTRLATVLDADISLEAKEQILGGNACRLFRIG
jgi:predicted TIM-barrel fold metal-dependent hydrolase